MKRCVTLLIVFENKVTAMASTKSVFVHDSEQIFVHVAIPRWHCRSFSSQYIVHKSDREYAHCIH